MARLSRLSLVKRLAAAAACGMFLGAATGPAFAATFAPPEGCTLQLTVQQRSCTVAQHFTCSADKPGDQWVAYFTRDGLTYQSRIDVETRWMESTDTVSGISDYLVDEAADHASISTLLKTGRDDFDFWTVSDTGERLRHIGQDDLIGTTVIDGVKLDTTRFKLKTFSEAGDLLIEREGTQFVSREFGRFYGGVENSSDWQGQTERTDDSPVKFIRPGQPNFGTTEPEYDCNAQMVGYFDGGGA